MGKRRLITDPSLASHLQTLADGILDYINESVRIEHANAHVWHHPDAPRSSLATGSSSVSSRLSYWPKACRSSFRYRNGTRPLRFPNLSER